MKTLILISLLGYGIPWQIHAQSPSTVREPRWYVSLQASHQRYPQSETEPGRGNESVYTLLPGQFNVGRRINDQVAVEVGVLARRRSRPVTVEKTIYPDTRYRYFSTTSDVTAVTIPVVGRFRILPPSNSRWHLNATIGCTLLLGSYQEVLTSSYDNRFDGRETMERRRIGDLPLQLGMGVRYQLSPRWHLTADSNFYWSWVQTLAVALGSSTSVVGAGGSVGMRHNFR